MNIKKLIAILIAIAGCALAYFVKIDVVQFTGIMMACASVGFLIRGLVDDTPKEKKGWMFYLAIVLGGMGALLLCLFGVSTESVGQLIGAIFALLEIIAGIVFGIINMHKK